MPVWRELLADLITPVAAFARLCRDDEPGFLLESVEHGERWSRWSFVGRRAAATFTARGLRRHGRPRRARRRSRSTRACSPPPRPCSPCYRAPSLAELPPLHSGLMGYLGYDVVREVEHLPERARRRPGPARRGAVDHRRAGRLRPLPPAGDPRRQRLDPAGRHARAISIGPTTRPSPDSTSWPLDGASPLDEPLVEPPASDRRAARGHLAERLGRSTGAAVEVAKEHILAGDIFQVVLSQRFDLRARRRPVRLLPGAAPGQPEPVHVLRAPAGADAGRAARPSPWCSCSRDG